MPSIRLALSALTATRLVCSSPVSTAAVYKDASAPPDARAQDLLSLMTWDEKIAQMGGVRQLLQANLTLNRTTYDATVQDLQNGILGLGSMLNQPRDVLSIINSIREEQINSTRLGIPWITVTDSVNGILLINGTLFPSTLGMAASWNVDLYGEAIGAIRDENHALGVHWVLSPEVDLGLDPRNGRVGEMYGEDQYLGGTFATKYIQTMQQRDEYGVKVATTIKHFLYGQSSGGVNTAGETGGLNKIFNTVGVPYMKAIKEAQPLSLMTSYAAYDHVPMAANRYLLQDVLRKEMGFEGLIMSDALAIPWLYEHQHVADSLLDAGIAALKAGLQMELSPAQPAVFPLLRSVTNDTTITTLVDEAVLAILKIKFTTGEFDRPLPDMQTLDETLRSQQHLETCREITQESIVLLQNDGLLPVASAVTRKIAVIGPFADILNPGSYAAAESTGNMSGNTLRQSFVNKVGADNVLFAQGVDITDTSDDSGIDAAVTAAKSAGLAVLMIGSLSVNTVDPLYQKRTDGEFFSHAYLNFPGLQQQLIDAVLDAEVPTVIVLSGGQAFALSNSTLRANAIAHSFLGGEFTGDSIADIIMGDVMPSGKLPVSLPQANGAWPIAYNLPPGDYYGGNVAFGSFPPSDWQLPYLGRTPSMPFGYGLSYTNFSLSSATTAKEHGCVTISAKLTNTGQRGGKEVVQLYFRKSSTTIVETANKQLVRFEKVSLDAGESRNVTFKVNIEELGYYVGMEKKIDDGLYHFWMGTSSRAEDLQMVNVTLTK